MTVSAVITAVLELIIRATIHTTAITTGPGNVVNSAQVGSFFAAFVPIFLVTVVLSFVVENILAGLLTAVIGRGVLGRKVSIRQAWAYGRIGPVLGAAVLLGLIAIAIPVPVALLVIVLALAHAGLAAGFVAFLGFLAVIVFEAIVQVRLSVTIPAVVLERVGPWTAIRRSWRLTRGSSWRLFGILLLTTILAAICTVILEIPLNVVIGVAGIHASSTGVTGAYLLTVIVGAVNTIVATSVIRPFSAGVTVLLYLDMRMRREGFDLALRNAAQDELTGDEYALWQPPAPGQWPPPGQWPATGPWPQQGNPAPS
jgi:hypothetical protein